MPDTNRASAHASLTQHHNFPMSATHHDPRTTATLDELKFGREIERIQAIIFVLLAGHPSSALFAKLSWIDMFCGSKVICPLNYSAFSGADLHSIPTRLTI